jgi:tetratricopeptide (TPR) repeat protein
VDEHIDPLAAFKAELSDRYRFERELGSGGMATVLLAEDLKHHRPVAVKLLKSELAAAVGSARFHREIAIAASLTHPNLLPLYDSGEAAGILYYVMPYVEGETLRERLKREKQLSVEDAVRIACDVVDGLQYAHLHDIIHRDVKPENILLQGNRAVVADFGIARAVSMAAKDTLTSSGIVIGTPQYMSPEQGLGEHDISYRSDIYSVGCVLYEMLAGEPPFTGPTAQAILTRHAVSDIPSIRQIRPDVSEELENIVRRALGKVPASRFASADELARSLRSYGTRKSRFRLKGRSRVAVFSGVALVTIVGVLVLAKSIFAGPLRQNDWILVADFDGPPNDPQLAIAFRDLVTADLRESRFVRVFERRQLNDIMRHAGIPETTFVTLELGRQLAQRSSVRAVLLGSIRPLGKGYSTLLHVVSAEDGTPLASAVRATRAPRGQSELVSAAEGGVEELRAELGERRSAIAANRPLRDVTTASFDAFRFYTAGLDRSLIQGDVPGSNRLLGRAIALDSGFASAWITLGANYLTARQLDSARFAYDKALALPNRISAAETYRLKGDVAYALDHDVPGAVKWYDLYLSEVPYSTSGRSNRALYRTAMGDYERAAADLEEAVAANPFGPELIQPALLNLAAVQVVLGRNKDARTTASQLSGAFADYLSIMLAMAESRWDAADSVATRVIATPEVQGVFRINALTSHASALAARGAASSADSVLAAAASASKGSTARWYERARLLLSIASGAPVPRRTDLLPNDSSVGARSLRALWAAEAGDTAGARAHLAELQALSRRDLAVVGTGPLLTEAWIAADGNRWREVIHGLGKVALIGELDPTILDRPDSFLLRWTVANAYGHLAQLDSSAVYLSLLLRPTRIPPGHYALRGLSYRFATRRLAEVDRLRGHSAVGGAD